MIGEVNRIYEYFEIWQYDIAQMKYFLLIPGLFCLCSMVAAQDVQPTQTLPSKSHLHADCTKFNSPGCKSFNVMAVADNPDLEDILDTASHSIVCFRRSEDVFFVIAYDQAKDSAFAGHEAGYKIPAVINFERFKNQAGDAFKGFLGNWQKEAGIIQFSADPQRNEPNVAAKVNPEKVNLTYQYPESATRDTGSGGPSADSAITYAFDVQLHGLRFMETITKTSSSTHTATQNTGTCISF